METHQLFVVDCNTQPPTMLRVQLNDVVTLPCEVRVACRPEGAGMTGDDALVLQAVCDTDAKQLPRIKSDALHTLAPNTVYAVFNGADEKTDEGFLFVASSKSTKVDLGRAWTHAVLLGVVERKKGVTAAKNKSSSSSNINNSNNNKSGRTTANGNKNGGTNSKSGARAPAEPNTTGSPPAHDGADSEGDDKDEQEKPQQQPLSPARQAPPLAVVEPTISTAEMEAEKRRREVAMDDKRVHQIIRDSIIEMMAEFAFDVVLSNKTGAVLDALVDSKTEMREAMYAAWLGSSKEAKSVAVVRRLADADTRLKEVHALLLTLDSDVRKASEFSQQKTLMRTLQTKMAQADRATTELHELMAQGGFVTTATLGLPFALPSDFKKRLDDAYACIVFVGLESSGKSANFARFLGRLYGKTKQGRCTLCSYEVVRDYLETSADAGYIQVSYLSNEELEARLKRASDASVLDIESARRLAGGPEVRVTFVSEDDKTTKLNGFVSLASQALAIRCVTVHEKPDPVHPELDVFRSTDTPGVSTASIWVREAVYDVLPNADAVVLHWDGERITAQKSDKSLLKRMHDNGLSSSDATFVAVTRTDMGNDIKAPGDYVNVQQQVYRELNDMGFNKAQVSFVCPMYNSDESVKARVDQLHAIDLQNYALPQRVLAYLRNMRGPSMAHDLQRLVRTHLQRLQAYVESAKAAIPRNILGLMDEESNKGAAAAAAAAAPTTSATSTQGASAPAQSPAALAALRYEFERDFDEDIWKRLIGDVRAAINTPLYTDPRAVRSDLMRVLDETWARETAATPVARANDVATMRMPGGLFDSWVYDKAMRNQSCQQKHRITTAVGNDMGYQCWGRLEDTIQTISEKTGVPFHQVCEILSHSPHWVGVSQESCMEQCRTVQSLYTLPLIRCLGFSWNTPDIRDLAWGMFMRRISATADHMARVNAASLAGANSVPGKYAQANDSNHDDHDDHDDDDCSVIAAPDDEEPTSVFDDEHLE